MFRSHKPVDVDRHGMAPNTAEGIAPRVVFCEHCGTIVDEPSTSNASVDCRLCGTTVSSAGAAAACDLTLVSVSFYLAARVRGSAVFEALVLHSAGVEHAVDIDPNDGGRKQAQRVRATVQEPCPKCKHPEMQYYTMQYVPVSISLSP